MKRVLIAALMLIAAPVFAESQDTVNLLQDKSRHMGWSDYIIVMKCDAKNATRRYEVTAGDSYEAVGYALEHSHRSKWCGYNEQIISNQEAR